MLVVELYNLGCWLTISHFQPNRVEVVPGGLNGVVPGLERLRADRVSGGKLVVHPQETI